jgi:hypothetical protein
MTKLKMFLKNRIPLLLIIAIIIIAFLFGYLSTTGIFDQKVTIEKSLVNNTPELANKNSSLKDFPPEIQGEIQTLSEKYSIAFNYWGFDPVNSEIDLIGYGILDTNAPKDLHGKKTGNYTIHVFNDTELETTRSEVRDYLDELKKNPDYQITPFMMVMDREGPYVDLWCSKLTPDNMKLDNKVIKGWRIHVLVCCDAPGSTGIP